MLNARLLVADDLCSWLKQITGKFSEKVSMGKKDEESAPLGTTVKN